MCDSLEYTKYPCGRCITCRNRRIQSWHLRLSEELKSSKNAYFITLTYDDDHLPFTENGLMTLNYRHHQLFMKKLRKTQQRKINYYTVGEYGEQTNRPHYHSIIFNIDNLVNVSDKWHYGHTHFGNVTDASIYYTLKYAHKSLYKRRPKDRDEDDDRVKERALMSKGLGMSFITPEMFDYFQDDVTRPVTKLGGQKIALPRYYRDKIFSEEQKEIRNQAMEEHTQKRLEMMRNPLYEQRVIKMTNKKIKQLQKTD